MKETYTRDEVRALYDELHKQMKAIEFEAKQRRAASSETITKLCETSEIIGIAQCYMLVTEARSRT